MDYDMVGGFPYAVSNDGLKLVRLGSYTYYLYPYPACIRAVHDSKQMTAIIVSSPLVAKARVLTR